MLLTVARNPCKLQALSREFTEDRYLISGKSWYKIPYCNSWSREVFRIRELHPLCTRFKFRFIDRFSNSKFRIFKYKNCKNHTHLDYSIYDLVEEDLSIFGILTRNLGFQNYIGTFFQIITVSRFLESSGFSVSL